MNAQPQAETRSWRDLSDVQWEWDYVKPGTPYPDEPSVTVPPGWYVLGYYPGSEDDSADIVVRVEQASDPEDHTGTDLAQEIAQLIADKLNG